MFKKYIKLSLQAAIHPEYYVNYTGENADEAQLVYYFKDGVEFEKKKLIVNVRFFPFYQENDIAIIRTQDEMKLGENARPICLPKGFIDQNQGKKKHGTFVYLAFSINSKSRDSAHVCWLRGCIHP